MGTFFVVLNWIEIKLCAKLQTILNPIKQQKCNFSFNDILCNKAKCNLSAMLRIADYRCFGKNGDIDWIFGHRIIFINFDSKKGIDGKTLS